MYSAGASGQQKTAGSGEKWSVNIRLVTYSFPERLSIAWHLLSTVTWCDCNLRATMKRCMLHGPRVWPLHTGHSHALSPITARRPLAQSRARFASRNLLLVRCHSMYAIRAPTSAQTSGRCRHGQRQSCLDGVRSAGSRSEVHADFPQAFGVYNAYGHTINTVSTCRSLLLFQS